ncbi:hypothetical protein [Palleronia caenipelagi]|uniref:Uncharacterized protein n=1 Tax=Palleronia caenipelagi TaxID=2489174 RepID=A0A547PUF3_9RHOB|nr:hypothetical protein [Palleronia caenipelagi]TRD17757.1 hypothetical protein FEV53_12840 [Palleronia caenipelagi]
MSYDENALLSHLANEYQIEKSDYIEYGACRLYRGLATSKDEREVWIYVPRPEVHAVSKARKALVSKFRVYRDRVSADSDPSLPEPFDFYSEKETKSAAALVTTRHEAVQIPPGLSVDEYPHMQGAMLRLLRSITMLETADLVQPPVGEKAVQIVRFGGNVQFLLDKIFFDAPEAVAPSLLFQPAFIAPEFTNLTHDQIIAQSNGPSGPPHVYALGKFFIYATSGPGALLRIFTKSVPDALEAEPEAAMSDMQLWTNIANAHPETDGTPLDSARAAGMSGELVDLTMRAVAHLPEKRPPNVPLFYEGFRSTVGQIQENENGGVDTGGGDRNTWTKTLVAAGVMATLVAGAGWLMLEQQQREREIAEARTEMIALCRPIEARLNSLEDTPFTEHPAWQEAVDEIDAALAIVEDNSRISDTEGHCRAARDHIFKVETETIAAQRRALQVELDFAHATGAAPALNLAEAEQLAVAETPQDDLVGFEVILRTETEALIAQHSTELEGRASALLNYVADLRGLWSVPAANDATLTAGDALISALEKAPGAARLRAVHLATDALAESAAGTISADISERVGALVAVAETLAAGLGETEDLIALREAIATAAEPLQALPSLVATQERYTSVVALEAKAEALRASTEAALAELSSLRALIDEIATSAEAEGYGADLALSEMLDQAAQLPKLAPALPEWQDIAGRIEDSAGVLSAEWSEGRAACARFLQVFGELEAEVANQPEEDTLRAAESIAQAITKGAQAGRDGFEQCIEAMQMVQVVAVAAPARKLLRNLEDARKKAIAFGVDDRVPQFQDLELAYATLITREEPVDQNSLSRLELDVQAVSDGYSAAADALANATAQFERLSVEEDEERSRAARMDLTSLSVWSEGLSAYPMPADNDPFQGNPQLLARITAMRDLIARFEQGEFVPCDLRGHEMIGIVASDRDVSNFMASPLARVASAGYVQAAGQRLAGHHCLSLSPVTIADLQAWATKLRATEQENRRQIEAAQVGPDGVAVNTSHYLASRYVEFLRRDTGQVVCVAPAELTLQALASASGRRLLGSVSEITGSRCDDTRAGRGRLAVIDPTNPGADPSCWPENERAPGAGFRVAMGDICKGE